MLVNWISTTSQLSLVVRKLEIRQTAHCLWSCTIRREMLWRFPEDDFSVVDWLDSPPEKEIPKINTEVRSTEAVTEEHHISWFRKRNKKSRRYQKRICLSCPHIIVQKIGKCTLRNFKHLLLRNRESYGKSVGTIRTATYTSYNVFSRRFARFLTWKP